MVDADSLHHIQEKTDIHIDVLYANMRKAARLGGTLIVCHNGELWKHLIISKRYVIPKFMKELRERLEASEKAA